MLGRSSPVLVVVLISSSGPPGGAASGSSEPPSKNAWDIAVIDKALATVKPGQKMVPFGDVGIKPEVLRAFRQKLVDEQGGNSQGPSPTADTPPEQHSSGLPALSHTGLIQHRFQTALSPPRKCSSFVTASRNGPHLQTSISMNLPELRRRIS